jgi:hypothetical protein
MTETNRYAIRPTATIPTKISMVALHPFQRRPEAGANEEQDDLSDDIGDVGHDA